MSSIPYVNTHSFEFLFNVWHFSLYTSTYLYINYSTHFRENYYGGGKIMLNNYHFYNLKDFFSFSVLKNTTLYSLRSSEIEVSTVQDPAIQITYFILE